MPGGFRTVPAPRMPMAEIQEDNRRKGPRDRRGTSEDRRNSERVADDLIPRRDPERQDRREREPLA